MSSKKEILKLAKCDSLNEVGKYIVLLVRELGLSKNTGDRAFSIAGKFVERVGCIGNPKVVAAATVYIAAHLNGERRTQREVADVLDITEVSIRNRYKHIAELLGVEIIL